MSAFPQIVVGTYEEFVLGYNPQYEDEKNTHCKLRQCFATHTHQASVRCVAAHNLLMASSGADEYINIYHMGVMEVSTVINYHNSTVTCLEFTPDGSHLVTANQGGDIAIFRCSDWTLVKLWKEAHKHANGVTSIGVHPSGSLLLTTGADNIVRFWNLVKGRQAYATNFSKKCSIGNFLNFGMWSKNGKFYAIGIGNMLEIYKTETAALVYQIKTNIKVTSSIFLKKNLICISLEDGSLELHSIAKKKKLLKKEAHKNRAKSLTSFSLKICKNNSSVVKNYIVSVDSKGEIKLWYFKKKGINYSLLLRGEANCGCRITCLTTVPSKNIKKEENDLPEEIPADKQTNVSNKNGIDEVNIISVGHSNKNKKTIKREIMKNCNGSMETQRKKLKNSSPASGKNEKSPQGENSFKRKKNENVKKKGFAKKLKAS